MANTDILDNVKREMRARLKELQPAVDEHRKIEQALRRMEHNRPGRKPKVQTEA
jgi:hypothetical protein